MGEAQRGTEEAGGLHKRTARGSKQIATGRKRGEGKRGGKAAGGGGRGGNQVGNKPQTTGEWGKGKLLSLRGEKDGEREKWVTS